MMRVLVCGGRAYNDARTLNDTLDDLKDDVGITAIIHGGSYGADRLAGLWAKFEDIVAEVYFADWPLLGKAAGPIRNSRMIAEGRPDLVIAFPGGRGTADLVRKARAAGIEVREIV